MVKKRSVFDIDFSLEDAPEQADGFPVGNQPAPETKSYNVQGHPLQNTGPVTQDQTALGAISDGADRRGPMASAISETLEAVEGRAEAEARIRAENDALAHEHVRLKKLGLITDLIPTASVFMSKLTRDRAAGSDVELEELKASIQSVGLSNPIRVEQTPEGYELIQGYRRLHAFRELAESTGDPRYQKIPAALVPRGEPLNALYRKMVDENLVRKDISFGEMALLAISYAHDVDLDLDAAVGDLYGSALKQKRRYIRQFAHVFAHLKDAVQFPEAVPRALGLELFKAFEAQDADIPQLVQRLQTLTPKTAETEAALLKEFVLIPTAQDLSNRIKSDAKTSLRLPRPEGEARVIATNGRIELRLNKDFSTVSKVKLESAIEALLTTLSDDLDAG